jgi:hypothetical protein
MNIQVYKIETFPAGNNHFGINRNENWSIIKDKEFENIDDAKEYVIIKSRLVTELPIFIISYRLLEMENNSNDETKFINDFCFDDDKYIKYRRYFIGYPPIDKIKESLKNDGIHIL